MDKHILITGGAGFIGSHLADALIRNGYSVEVPNNRSEQIHGTGRRGWRAACLNPEIKLIEGELIIDGISAPDCLPVLDSGA
ncbi:MAG: NAD-dependent epimerase/dehydratase family protein [bacterium]